MIKHLKGLEINTIYDFDNAFSINELLCKFWEKIEETINISNESIDILNWIKEEGIPKEVEELITKLVEDGTIEQMINVDKIEELRTLITNKISDINEQLDNIAKKQFIFIDDYINDNTDFISAYKNVKQQLIDGEGYYTLILGAKTYTYSETLLLDKNIKIKGVSRDKTKLKYTGSGIAISQTNNDTMQGDIYSDVTNVVLEDFRLEGDLKINTTGIHLVNGGNLSINRVEIANFDINVILGHTTQEQYILFSRFNFDSVDYISKGVIIRDVQDSQFDRILIGGSHTTFATSNTVGLQIGDVANHSDSKPMDLVFNTLVVQLSDIGFYLDGGLGITIVGGHAESIKRLFYQTINADSGTKLINFFPSGTVESNGVLNGNGVDYTDITTRGQYFDKRLMMNKTITCSDGLYELFEACFILNNFYGRYNRGRLVFNFSSNNDYRRQIKLIDMSDWSEVCSFDFSGTSTDVITDWQPINQSINYSNKNRKILLKITSENATDTITFNYIDFQAY